MTEEQPTLRYTPPEHEDTETFTGFVLPEGPDSEGRIRNYKALLIAMNGVQKGQRFRIINKETVIGRSRKADLFISEPGTSRLHARITYEGVDSHQSRPYCYIEDLNSRNGTEVNGVPISGKVTLNERDRITLGRAVLGYFVRDEEELTQDEHLYEIATRDQLTGLDNRRQLLAHMRHYMGLAGRHRGMLCLVMIDIDDFKLVNDTYGHKLGDETLRHVAQVLASCVRESDLLARWGGEEFAICLPESTLENATSFANRITEEIRTNPFRKGDILIPLTVSVGISCFRDTDSTSELFERADACLYEAKHSGKNRTVVENELKFLD